MMRNFLRNIYSLIKLMHFKKKWLILSVVTFLLRQKVLISQKRVFYENEAMCAFITMRKYIMSQVFLVSYNAFI